VDKRLTAEATESSARTPTLHSSINIANNQWVNLGMVIYQHYSAIPAFGGILPLQNRLTNVPPRVAGLRPGETAEGGCLHMDRYDKERLLLSRCARE
jgi:hypothetical protein